jgi:transcriptional regulator with XRE-family HTH domain
MRQSIGEAIKGQRELQGWTQERLAEAAGVAVRTNQRIEAGEAQPYGATLNNIAGALRLTVPQLKLGQTAEQIAAMQDDFLCPGCGAQLLERMAVPNDYGDDLLEVFECGHMRGARRRPCPADPTFPHWEDYELRCEREMGSEDRWYCYALGRTESARAVELSPGRGRTREEAQAWVRNSYIAASEGNEAARRFLSETMSHGLNL